MSKKYSSDEKLKRVDRVRVLVKLVYYLVSQPRQIRLLLTITVTTEDLVYDTTATTSQYTTTITLEKTGFQVALLSRKFRSGIYGKSLYVQLYYTYYFIRPPRVSIGHISLVMW